MPNSSNHISKLLTVEEANSLTSAISSSEICLASAVVKLYITRAPLHRHWLFHGVGVICLCACTTNFFQYFRFFDFNLKKFSLEEELYLDFDFLHPKPYLITFEGNVGYQNIIFYFFLHKE
uniref:Neural Wiskott-Aldrich syndrome protein (Trinotate prediction) n=1 Tax=Henneguya salminicola TaxID=69463 RepID=A0A6G3MKW6_HENSL